MSNSPLAVYTRLSPNRTSPRNHAIDTITIHCYVGQVTAESAGAWFAKETTRASCNYVVDKDGRIGLIVDESNMSWCSSSFSNDHRAVTIEVASDMVHPYAVTDKAYTALIELCADICKRNGIPKLLWQGDKSLVGQVDRQNLTVHRWFANKACPGDYLYGLMGDIAAQVNERLEESDMTKDEVRSIVAEAINEAKPKVYTSVQECPAWARTTVQAAINADVLNGDGAGKLHLTDDNLLTLQMLYNLNLFR